jgi:hypothetical protein
MAPHHNGVIADFVVSARRYVLRKRGGKLIFILARPPPHNTRVEGRTYRRRQISRPPKEMAERTQDIAAPYINAFGLREGLLECTPSRIGTIVGQRVAELSQMCRESHPWNGRGPPVVNIVQSSSCGGRLSNTGTPDVPVRPKRAFRS